MGKAVFQRRAVLTADVAQSIAHAMTRLLPQGMAIDKRSPSALQLPTHRVGIDQTDEGIFLHAVSIVKR